MRLAVVASVALGLVVLAPVPSRAADATGRTWRIVASPTPPPGWPDLESVACPAADHCFAVGSSAGTLIESWNGTRWTLVRSPNPPDIEGLLTSVACADTSHCVAVGRYGRPIPKTFAVAWNGARWSPMKMPDGIGDQVDLWGVACPSVTSCFAVGSYIIGAPDHEDTLIERWHGTHWTVQGSPNPDFYYNELHAVSCSSRSHCIAVGTTAGHPFVLRWDGVRWKQQPTPPGTGAADLNGVSCVSPSSCMAVGDRLNGNPFRTLAMRWDGTRWTIVATPNPSHGGSLEDVDCLSASECTATGRAGYTTARTLVEHWNGTQWLIEPSPNLPRKPSFLSGVACTSARSCFAVGSAFDETASQTLIERST